MSKTTKTGKMESTTAVALNTEMSTPDIIAALDAKLATLEGITTTKYKTNGNVAGFGDVKTETDISKLIKMYSSISGREKAYNAAAETLGLKAYPAFTEGGSAEDWFHDINLRIQIIQHKDTVDTLNRYKKEMAKFMSEADQKAQLIAEMAKFAATLS